MFQLKVDNCTYLNDCKDCYTYKLDTNIGEIELKIATWDELKKALIEFSNTPFYIITEKNIAHTIKTDDYFEVANTQSTINLECTASCRVDYNK